jgi:superfamily II DNA/RNA helicase
MQPLPATGKRRRDSGAPANAAAPDGGGAHKHVRGKANPLDDLLSTSSGEAEDVEGEGDSVFGGEGDDHLPITVVAPVLPSVDVLITTPLLLVAVLRHAAASANASPDGKAAPPRLRSRAVLPSLRILIADEVDKLMEENFLEQTDEIYAAARPASDTLSAWAAAAQAGGTSLPPPPQKAVICAMFSATLPPAVEALAGGVLRDPLR